MFCFDTQKKCLRIENSPFANGMLTYNFSSFTTHAESLNWSQLKTHFSAEQNGIEYIIYTADDKFYTEVVNKSSNDVYLKDVQIQFTPQKMSEKLFTEDYLELIHPKNFENGAGVKKVGLSSRLVPHNPESFLVYALKHIDNDSSYLFFAHPDHQNDYTSFKALHDSSHLQGNFGLLIKSDQQRLIPAASSACSTAISCLTGCDPMALLEQVGKRYGKYRSMPLKPVQIGWNSWDYYAGAVTSKDMFRNQDSCNELFDGIPNCMVIDEGWEPRWGVWEANWKFPENLDGYCRQIKDKGGSPGIWTAPLLVNSYTDIYRDNPSWFGRNNNGEIVSDLLSYGPMAYLDITNPEVEEFIYSIFQRLRNAGFDYFKVDFTQLVMNCTQFHDMTIGRGGIIRKTFEVIRKAIGPDAYLVACGAHYQSVTGIVDACRTTGDIHNFWSHVYTNAAGVASRWWFHRNVWNNDPDFLIVRSPETAPGTRLNREHKSVPFSYNPGWLTGREWNLKEARTYALLVYASAGDIMLSDNLSELNETGLTLIRKILDNPLQNAAKPIDLFAAHDKLPSIWVSKEPDHTFIAVFNWDENARDVVIDLEQLNISATSATLFWDNQPIDIMDGKIKIHLKHRASEGIILKYK